MTRLQQEIREQCLWKDINAELEVTISILKRQAACVHFRVTSTTI